MTATQYLRAFARFWWLIVLCTLLGAVIGVLAVSSTATKYTATSSVILGSKKSASPPADQYTATVLAEQASVLAEQRMPTYVAIGANDTLAEATLNGSGIPLTADQLRSRIALAVPQNSQIMTITVTDTDENRVVMLASKAATAMAGIINAQDPGKQQGTAVLLHARVLSPSPILKQVAAPPTWRNPSLLGAAGLLIGLGLAVAWARLDPRLRDPEVVGELIGGHVLARLPSGRRPWSRGRSRTAYDVGVRELRTGIFFLRHDPAACLVVAVTGPSSHDRLHQLAADVSRSMAGTGSKVLLVDADLQAARQAPLVAPDDASTGLATYLSGGSSLQDAIEHDPESGVDVVPAGTAVHDAADLLHSTAFEGLLERAALEYDYVLVAAPPATAGTGASAVAALCDATILVVDGRLKARSLRDSVRQLDNVEVRPSGAVILT